MARKVAEWKERVAKIASGEISRDEDLDPEENLYPAEEVCISFLVSSVILFLWPCGLYFYELFRLCVCVENCLFTYRLVGLVVKVSASRAEDSGFNSHLWCWDFSRSSHTSDLKMGSPVATLLGTWHYRVSAGTDRPGVSILWLGEVESWNCNFYLSVAALKIVWADPSPKYFRMLLGH